jgi:hypothetical protein
LNALADLPVAPLFCIIDGFPRAFATLAGELQLR